MDNEVIRDEWGKVTSRLETRYHSSFGSKSRTRVPTYRTLNQVSRNLILFDTLRSPPNCLLG